MELEGLNLPLEVAQRIADGLAAVGLRLPLFATQLFLLLLALAAAGYGLLRLRREGVKDLPGLLLTVAFGLFALGVLIGWGNELLHPLPGRFNGRIDRIDRQGPDRFQGMRVELRNSRGEKVSHEAGILDSRTGFFALSYRPRFADPPRTLHVTAPGCGDLDHTLQRPDLEQAGGVTIGFRCRP
ncbi:MAG TPA: hypothetical protein ENI96_10360 [Sedimenticola thiotaurini]|uniref:Uncharacterized protein n=1 Tax=Sedimenticola thiotaurini TaxID=1543721 RepID=A0A831WB32_9GAMM|nr:hypothetical protein [Sedimenticola thiotaurini]